MGSEKRTGFLPRGCGAGTDEADGERGPVQNALRLPTQGAPANSLCPSLLSQGSGWGRCRLSKRRRREVMGVLGQSSV